mmetsp:Transcript_5173/g.15717  ORF Transcript_5173/g.15717 Transcript_5173/m.15717 type:complete len:111 (-) Transcript_5173:1074-1406(-)
MAARSLLARSVAVPRRVFSEMSSAKHSGTVKWFNAVKGFGFIKPNQGGGDVFVHHSEIYAKGFRSLADGEAVEYEVDVDPSGRERAIAVTGPDGVYVQGTPPPRRPDFDH